MNISYNWLKEYIDIDLSTEELEQKLTFSGIEVEGTKILGQELEQILVGKIIQKIQHPDADKLALCKVDIGDNISVLTNDGAKRHHKSSIFNLQFRFIRVGRCA